MVHKSTLLFGSSVMIKIVLWDHDLICYFTQLFQKSCHESGLHFFVFSFTIEKVLRFRMEDLITFAFFATRVIQRL